jgi:hypothetical protein
MAAPKACGNGARVPTYTHPRGGLLKERARCHRKVGVYQRNRRKKTYRKLYADHVQMYKLYLHHNSANLTLCTLRY